MALPRPDCRFARGCRRPPCAPQHSSAKRGALVGRGSRSGTRPARRAGAHHHVDPGWPHELGGALRTSTIESQGGALGSQVARWPALGGGDRSTRNGHGSPIEPPWARLVMSRTRRFSPRLTTRILIQGRPSDVAGNRGRPGSRQEDRPGPSLRRGAPLPTRQGSPIREVQKEP